MTKGLVAIINGVTRGIDRLSVAVMERNHRRNRQNDQDAPNNVIPLPGTRKRSSAPGRRGR